MAIESAVLVALITGGCALLGNIISARMTSQHTDDVIKAHMDVQDTKIEELTREVRNHNGFAERIPKLEAEIENLRRQCSRCN